MQSFENEIIREILATSEKELLPFVDKAINEVIEYSGVGYFLTIEHSDFPIKHSILTSPNINGVLGGVDVGFIVIIQIHNLH